MSHARPPLLACRSTSQSLVLVTAKFKHVVGVGRKRAGLAVEQVDDDARDPGILQTPASVGVVEAGRAVHLVVACQRARQRLGHLAGDAGDDDLGPPQRCPRPCVCSPFVVGSRARPGRDYGARWVRRQSLVPVAKFAAVAARDLRVPGRRRVGGD